MLPLTLDGVRPCLVERLAGVGVALGFLPGEVAHGHQRHLEPVLDDLPVVGERPSGDHSVGAATEAQNHVDGVVAVRRLAEGFAVEDDCGVGAQRMGGSLT